MAFEDPWLKNGGTMSPIDFERRLFEQTENPVHVWRAIRICSELMLGKVSPVVDSYPEWVMQYLAAVSAGIDEIFYAYDDGRVANLGVELAATLKFKAPGQGKRSDAFSDHKREHRDHMLAIEIRRRLRENPGLSARQACSDLAEDHAEAARQFQTLKRTGAISPWSEPFHHQVPYSAETIYDAWKAWGGFVHPPANPSSE